MRSLHASLALLVLGPTASAQSVEHYWNFMNVNDVVGGVPTSAIGSPDLSIHPTYGEAYPGAGASFNPILGGPSAGGGILLAQVLTGTSPMLDWGMDSYSFSYWVWDDFAADGDVKGPRVFDSLLDPDTGIQLGTNTPGYWNLRNDDDAGGACIFDRTVMYIPPQDRWVHIVGVTDRTLGEVRLYEDGVFIASTPLVDSATGVPLTGNILPSQDLEIGGFNGGNNANEVQACGIDDLAFYRGVLSTADITGLASGALTPLDLLTVGTRYCAPAVANSTGVPARMTVAGSPIVATNIVTLVASDLPLNSFGLFLTSQTQGMVLQPGGSQGVLCLGGAIGRYVGPGQIQNSGASGRFSLPIDLTLHPTPNGLVTVMAMETWNFQAWYRDGIQGVATSNFTDAVSVQFQ